MPSTAKDGEIDRRWRGWLVAWFVLALAVLLPRFIVAGLAVSPNKDAIRYWAAADQWLALPWRESLACMETLPVYPAALGWLKWSGWASTPEMWWRASQCLGIVCYLVVISAALVVGNWLVGQPRAWWGCLLVSLLPRQIRYSVDILADNMSAALLWSALALWYWGGMKSSRSASWLWVSVLLGLAMLCRPDAYLWSVVLILVSAAMVFRRESPWLGLVYLLAPMVILWGSHGLIRGELAPSNTARGILGVPTIEERGPTGALASEGESRTPLDHWIGSIGELSLKSVVAAIGITVWEAGQETRVLLLLFFVVGLFAGEIGRWPRPFVWVGLLLGTFLMLAWCRWQAGFLTSRYFMPILPLVGFVAVAGLDRVIEMVSKRGLFREMSRVSIERFSYGAALTLALGLALPAAVWPLHADRWGHRQAAEWLKKNTAPGEAVFDPSWVSAYFAGRPMTIPMPGTVPRIAVLDVSLASAPPAGLSSEVAWATNGKVLAEFPRRLGSRETSIRIVEMPASPMARREDAPRSAPAR